MIFLGLGRGCVLESSDEFSALSGPVPWLWPSQVCIRFPTTLGAPGRQKWAFPFSHVEVQGCWVWTDPFPRVKAHFDRLWQTVSLEGMPYMNETECSEVWQNCNFSSTSGTGADSLLTQRSW